MFSEGKIVNTGNDIYVEYGNDSSAYVEFRYEAVHQIAKSQEEGRAIFDDLPFIRIMFAGDKTKIIDRPVQDVDKRRFAKQWDAFINGAVKPIDGTPLSEWAILTKKEIAEFNAMNIYTIEALANIPDSMLNWLGARAKRDQAVSFLQGHGAEIAKRDNQIRSLQEQINKLTAKFGSLTEEKTKKDK